MNQLSILGLCARHAFSCLAFALGVASLALEVARTFGLFVELLLLIAAGALIRAARGGEHG